MVLLIALSFVLYIIHCQTINILLDGIPFIDDYKSNNLGKGGWAYDTVFNGSVRQYHGLFSDQIDLIRFGYFYQSFRCQFDSTVSMSFDAYLGCNYETDGTNADGGEIYINEKKIQWKVSEYIDSIVNVTDDSNLQSKAYNCSTIPFKGRLNRINVDLSSKLNNITVYQHNLFDIGVRPFITGPDEFIAFSEIMITCNKLDQISVTATPTKTPTPSPTYYSIDDPSQSEHITCSTMNKTQCNNNAHFCIWEGYLGSQCSCNSGDPVDIIFGLQSSLGASINNWMINDVIPNINGQISRVGISIFSAENISTIVPLGNHPNEDIESSLVNSSQWSNGNIPMSLMLDSAINDFDTIIPLTQQILVMVMNQDSKLAGSNGQPSSACQYRNVLMSKNIRVIIIGIGNTSMINVNNYDCLVTYPWDIMQVKDYIYPEINVLSALLCPNTINVLTPTFEPTTKTPTIVLTIPPPTRTEYTTTIDFHNVTVTLQDYDESVAECFANYDGHDPRNTCKVSEPLDHRLILGGIAAAFAILIIMSYIHAKYYKHNDFYRWGAIRTAGVHIIDMVSDILFTMHIACHPCFEWDITDTESWLFLIFLLSIVFIVFPVFITLWQLSHEANKHWLKDHQEPLKEWYMDYGKMLYFLSLLSGSSFSGVELCSSNMFSLRVFSLPISKRRLKSFENKSYSLVFAENIPQLGLQIWYIIASREMTSEMVYFAMVFSLLSIFIAMKHRCTQNRLLFTQSGLIIKFDVTGQMIAGKLSHCEQNVNKIKQQIAFTLGVEHRLVDIMPPEPIPHGLQITLIISMNRVKTIDKYMKFGRLLETANDSGELGSIFQTSWGLNEPPAIANFKFTMLDSKKSKRGTIHIPMDDHKKNYINNDEKQSAVPIAPQKNLLSPLIPPVVQKPLYQYGAGQRYTSHDYDSSSDLSNDGTVDTNFNQ